MRRHTGAILMVAGALMAACAESTEPTPAGSPPTTAEPTDAQTPTPTPEPTPMPAPTPVDCSAAGMDPTSVSQEGLSAEAEATRQHIIELTVACDYRGLEQLAREGRDYFTFSFGGGRSPARYWRGLERAGEPVLRKLLLALGIDFVASDQASGRVFSWPSAAQENPSDADWQAVVESGLHTQEEIDFMREQTSGYLGWRGEITEDGDWISFVAGD